MGGSFSFIRSTKQWDLRRKYMSKILAVNYCSKHIGMMLQTVDKNIDQLKVGDSVNFNQIIKHTTLMIICKILFGQDIEDNMPTGLYINPDTFEQSQMRFDELFSKVVADEFRFSAGPMANFFPILAYNNLINPQKTSRKNIDECKRVILEFSQKSADKDSVYNLLKSYNSSEEEKMSEEELILDVVVMLFAGFDTSSYAIISLLYQLKMNPDKLHKLKLSLDESKITQIDELSKPGQKEAYQNCDYLYYCIKEGLRIDTPVDGSLYYEALDAVTICGVPIGKGEVMAMNTLYPHYNPDYFEKPFE